MHARMNDNRKAEYAERRAGQQLSDVNETKKSFAQFTSSVSFSNRGVLQRRPSGQAQPMSVPPVVHQVLRSLGEPLDPQICAEMESRFGYDFSEVQIHRDIAAQQATALLGANGFTSGTHIAFGPGRRPEDRTLLAHELSHIIQQAEGQTSTLEGLEGDTRTRNTLEWEASQTSSMGARGKFKNRKAENKPLAPLRNFRTNVVQLELEQETSDPIFYIEQLLRYRFATGEQERISSRRSELRRAFDSLNASQAMALIERLLTKTGRIIPEGGFEDVLSTPTRIELLLILFWKLEPSDAKFIHDQLTNPKASHYKLARRRFRRLVPPEKDPYNQRLEMLRILARKISASRTQEPSETIDEISETASKPPGLWNVISPSKNFPFLSLSVRSGVTIDDVARYVSEDPDLPNVLARLNNLPREQLLDERTLIRIPPSLVTRPEAKRDIERVAETRQRTSPMLRQKTIDFIQVETQGRTIGLAPRTTASVEALVGPLLYLTLHIIEFFECMVNELGKAEGPDIIEQFLDHPFSFAVEVITFPSKFWQGVMEGGITDAVNTVSDLIDIVLDPAAFVDSIFEIVNLVFSRDDRGVFCALGGDLGEQFADTISRSSAQGLDVLGKELGKIVGPAIVYTIVSVLFPAVILPRLAPVLTRLAGVLKSNNKLRGIIGKIRSRAARKIRTQGFSRRTKPRRKVDVEGAEPPSAAGGESLERAAPEATGAERTTTKTEPEELRGKVPPQYRIDAETRAFLEKHGFTNYDEATGIATKDGGAIQLSRTTDGRWVHNAEGKIVTEYQIYPYNKVPGTKGFFNGHHAIQDAWARGRFGKLGPQDLIDPNLTYGSDKAPTILLRDVYKGTPHYKISLRQRTARQTPIGMRTYAQERVEMIADLKHIGIPDDVQKQMLKEADDYFRTLRNNIKDPALRDQIFGDWKG